MTAIAAIVLYLTAVSSVRGFALTLGVATVLDLFVVYFFKRPTVFLIARSPRLVLAARVRPHERRGREEHEAVAPRVPVGGWGRMNLQHAIATYRGHTIPHFRSSSTATDGSRFSAIVIVLSLVGSSARGLNLSIDFEGGAQINYPFDGAVTVQDVHRVLQTTTVTPTRRCRS